MFGVLWSTVYGHLDKAKAKAKTVPRQRRKAAVAGCCQIGPRIDLSDGCRTVTRIRACQAHTLPTPASP